MTAAIFIEKGEALKIDIEPDPAVDVLVTMRYDVAGAPAMPDAHGPLSFFPEKVIVQVLNGNLGQAIVTGHQALKTGLPGTHAFKRVWLREDLPDAPLWLINLIQASILNVGTAGLVP